MIRRRQDFLRNSYHFPVSWRSIADLCLQNLGDGSTGGEENRDCGATAGMRLYPPPHHDLTHSRLPQGARDPRYHLQHETLNCDTSNIPLKDKHLWSWGPALVRFLQQRNAMKAIHRAAPSNPPAIIVSEMHWNNTYVANILSATL